MEPDPLRLYKQLDDLGVRKVRAKAKRGEYSADALPVVHFWLKLHEKPHWSLTPLFWVSVVAALAACIAAYPVIFPAPMPHSAPVGSPALPADSASHTESSTPAPSQ